jgi:hypothetical protein
MIKQFLQKVWTGCLFVENNEEPEMEQPMERGQGQSRVHASKMKETYLPVPTRASLSESSIVSVPSMRRKAAIQCVGYAAYLLLRALSTAVSTQDSISICAAFLVVVSAYLFTVVSVMKATINQVEWLCGSTH